jgi:DMSO reductase anchor subunit
MLTLTQLSAGTFLYLSLAWGAGRGAAIAAALVALVSLAASTLHLGRPIHAWRALKMWRRSWLSREVLLFSLFAGAAVVSPVIPVAAAAAAVLGFAGVTASAFIYLVPARPAWNSKQTLVDFYLTALLLGPLFLGVLGVRTPLLATVLAAVAQLLNQTVKLLRLTASYELAVDSKRHRDSHSVQPKVDAANGTIATDQAGLAPLNAQAATDA